MKNGLIVACALLLSAPLEGAVQVRYRADVQPDIDTVVEDHLDRWVAFYKTCHANPELSLQEKASAARLAERLRALDLQVTEHVGGYGVVGILHNGEGPSILLRGDMDALPLEEQTGLPYASKVKVRREDGTQVGVMHACGHDVHQTVLMASTEVLVHLKDRWRGTLMVIGQPAEEIGRGARMMIADGLFTRFGVRPDACLAMHVDASKPVGVITYTPGWATANVDSVDITVIGRGGHGSRPEDAEDPIVAAAAVVMNLQTLVSRRVPPQEAGVVTVGSIHAGSKHNIIPRQAHLQLTVRSYTDEVRRTLLDGIRQITVDTCRALGCTTAPVISVRQEDFTAAGYNDPRLSAELDSVFKAVLGEAAVIQGPPIMGGEDFGLYARQLEVPGMLWWLGTVPPERHAQSLQDGGTALPSLHAPTYAPEAVGTIRCGVRSMAAAVLSVLSAR